MKKLHAPERQRQCEQKVEKSQTEHEKVGGPFQVFVAGERKHEEAISKDAEAEDRGVAHAGGLIIVINLTHWD